MIKKKFEKVITKQKMQHIKFGKQYETYFQYYFTNLI